MRYIIALKNYEGECNNCGAPVHIPLLTGTVVFNSDDNLELILSSISIHHCNSCLIPFDLFKIRLSCVDVTNEFRLLTSKKEGNA